MLIGQAAPETAEDGGHPRPRRRRPARTSKSPRFAPAPTTASIIGWTALSALIPGAAHLRAGRRRAGLILLGAFAVLLVAVAVLALTVAGNVGFAAKDGLLAGLIVAAVIGALAWFLLVLFSYIALGPDRLPQHGQIVSGIVVGVMCVGVMGPFALAANHMAAARDAANTIFQGDGDDPTAEPIKQEDPWNGKTRVNFLLIGGDAAGNRQGVRTDSMNVASVDIRTGNTVLISLPRNLQYVRFPKSSPLHDKFPNGFTGEDGQGLLNEVWYYTETHPEVQDGGRYRGPHALKDAIGYTLNLKIHYYVLVDMYGFAALVDAIGGIRIRVEQDIKWGGLYGTAGTIKAGYRRLNGEEALWYGRSRVGSDDFARMKRQRCVIGAIAKQATPSVVLANFTRIAQAAKRMFRTDIPRDLLEHLVPLALKVKNARITSLQFVPPLIFTGNPDWAKIRRETAKALRESVAAPRSPAATAAATPRARTGTVAASPERPAVQVSRTPSPLRTAPTANGTAARSLDELCGF